MRAHGVVAHEGVPVRDILFGDQRAVGIKIQLNDGTQREVPARVVFDASSQSGLLQNKFKLRIWDPVLNKDAIWTYRQGAHRDQGREAGATMVLQIANRLG